jgi:hypothetical protein
MKQNTTHLAILSKGFQVISLSFILLLTLSIAQAAIPLDLSKPDPSAKRGIIESYGKLPLSFESNQGQIGGEVCFLSRGPGYRPLPRRCWPCASHRRLYRLIPPPC